jgi:hypothetical protein
MTWSRHAFLIRSYAGLIEKGICLQTISCQSIINSAEHPVYAAPAGQAHENQAFGQSHPPGRWKPSSHHSDVKMRLLAVFHRKPPTLLHTKILEATINSLGMYGILLLARIKG